MVGGIAAVVAIVFFVVAHEAGHFLAAKAVGMKATEFFFGFGPKLWSTKKGETEYGFKAIPLGGYVRIVGMNPLEEVAPRDMGRTYREKKFWEKSVVVLAGVGANFLLAFFLFYGLALSTGIPGDVVPVVGAVVEETPAEQAGIRVGDRIVAVNGEFAEAWQSIADRIGRAGPGPAVLTIERNGSLIDVEVVLAESQTTPGAGFLGVSPTLERIEVGPLEGIGVAGQLVGDGITGTFRGLGQMFQPSSLVRYLGVLVGQVEVPDDIRPISPIGIVAIGSQTDSLALFIGIMATVNVILGTINLLPLFPLDGGHFAVAVYEKATGRTANMRALVPIATAVIGVFIFLGLVAIILDITNPINL